MSSTKDKVFYSTVFSSCFMVIVFIILAIAVLCVNSFGGVFGDAENNNILRGESFINYIVPLIFGTLYSSFLALIIAIPLSISIALFAAFFAKGAIAKTLRWFIDILSFVPSIIFGLWGAVVLAPFLTPAYQWINNYLGFIPIFSGQVSTTGRTILTASIVLSLMITPIISAMCTEIFLKVPILLREASLGLGATKWEEIRLSVFPYCKKAIIAACALGLGRAMGETLAVSMVLTASGIISFELLSSSNPSTIASNIALNFGESSGTGSQTLIATGLCLFLLTFIISIISRLISIQKTSLKIKS